MNARLIKVWQDLQSSYYFVPALMGMASCLIAALSVYIDLNYQSELKETLGVFYSDAAQGSNAIFITIAGSMMTVAAVAFSITMVAVTSAAGQYGPRLIGNFMRDRGNQITLGTFTSTFIYCLLILHVSRSGGTAEMFLPNFSLGVAILLTLISVGVMIYFIHHVPETLNVSNITAEVGRELRDNISDLFSAGGERKSETGQALPLPDLDAAQAYSVRSSAEGYVQTVNVDALFDKAKELDLVLEFTSRPGDFVTKDDTLLRVWGLESCAPDLRETALKSLSRGFALGLARTSHQNVIFLADELVEILGRALSPGINDPFTAINCIHWYKSVLKAFMRQDLPPAHRFDSGGHLRLIAPPIDFDLFLGRICDQSRTYIATDRNTATVMLQVLLDLVEYAKTSDQKTAVQNQIARLKQAVLVQITSEPDLSDLKSAFTKGGY